MAISYDWKIISLEREVSDGYVFHAEWYVNASDGSHEADAYGQVKLERPDGALIPYEDLTQDVVLEWAKDKLGDGVALIEAGLARNIEEQAAPTVASGVPWA